MLKIILSSLFAVALLAVPTTNVEANDPAPVTCHWFQQTRPGTPGTTPGALVPTPGTAGQTAGTDFICYTSYRWELTNVLNQIPAADWAAAIANPTSWAYGMDATRPATVQVSRRVPAGTRMNGWQFVRVHSEQLATSVPTSVRALNADGQIVLSNTLTTVANSTSTANEWYLFNNGRMLTGWQQPSGRGGAWYFLADNRIGTDAKNTSPFNGLGRMFRNGVFTDIPISNRDNADLNAFRFNNNGVMLTSWVNLPANALGTGSVAGYYRFGINGLQTNQWIGSSRGNWFFVSEDGLMVAPTDTDNTFRLPTSNNAIRNGRAGTETSHGVWPTNNYTGMFMLAANGAMYGNNGAIFAPYGAADGVLYVTRPNGSLVLGDVENGGTWYEVPRVGWVRVQATTNRLVRNVFATPISDIFPGADVRTRYFSFNERGVMQTGDARGWIRVETQAAATNPAGVVVRPATHAWIHVDPLGSGELSVGWQRINERWVYFHNTPVTGVGTLPLQVTGIFQTSNTVSPRVTLNIPHSDSGYHLFNDAGHHQRAVVDALHPAR